MIIPSIEIGIDTHLFAGDGVQCKPRGNFGRADRTFGDNDEVDQHQDDENNRTNDIIPAEDKQIRTI